MHVKMSVLFTLGGKICNYNFHTLLKNYHPHAHSQYYVLNGRCVAKRVQILDKAIYISLRANAFEKGMDPPFFRLKLWVSKRKLSF